MAFFRVQKDTNYTVMSNFHLRDKTLSLAAKGLLSVILSLPDGWDFSKKGLLSLIGETEYTLDKLLDELKEHRYLSIVKVNPADGKQRISWEYFVYESPDKNTNPTPPQKREKQSTDETKNNKSQYPEIQGIETQGIENRGIYKILNKSNTKQINTEGGTKAKRERFTPPTLEEVKAFCETDAKHVNAEKFFHHYSGQNWKGVTDWKAKVLEWEAVDSKDTERRNAAPKSRKPMDERTVTDEDFETGYYADIMNRPRPVSA